MKQPQEKLGAACLREDSKTPREKRGRHTGRPGDCHKGSQKGMDETAQARSRQLWATVDLLTQEPVPSLWETAVRAATISGHSFHGPLQPDLSWPSLLGHLAKQQSPDLT